MNERKMAQKRLAQICQVIVEVVAETPNGAPCEAVYAALTVVMPEMTALQFNMVIAGLQGAGKVERHCNHLYPPGLTDVETSLLKLSRLNH